MHTVIILSKHSSNLLKDYRFLFKPFVDNETISFCDWNESGTDLTASVPDLYKLIRGKLRWRAVIVDTEPAFGVKNGPVPDEKNPFDYPEEMKDTEVPQASSIPIIRLTHMLCGYPSAPVKNFEDGYEYTDDITGKVKRVRASELSREEFYNLSVQYKDRLRRIYMEEQVPPEVQEAQKALEEKYSFKDVRPQEVYLVRTRRHMDDEDHIYASWKSPIEMESSDFCRRNNYPGICRFLCSSITNPENSRYVKELMEFWLSVLTLSVNAIPASSLQAYKLYRLGVEISEEEMSRLLNEHLNKMEAAYAFVNERLRMRPEYSFGEEEKLVEKQHIPVTFEGTVGTDLYVDTRHVGLSRDCPDDEMVYWNGQIREKNESLEKFLKAPRRAVDKASQYAKRKADSFLDHEYELDQFQIADLEDEINVLELQVLTSDTHSLIDEKKIKEELNKADKRVRKDIDARMRKKTVIGMGLVFLLIYMIGYFPYIFNSLRTGGWEFLASLGLTAAATVLISSGGLIALFLLRRKLVRSMGQFNTLMRELVKTVNASAKKFEQFFSVLCTFMKAQSIYAGSTKKSSKVSSRVMKLRTHRQALSMSMERDEQIAAAFGIKRAADFEKNVTRFFDEDRLPRDNRLYYYEVDHNNTEIPLNTAGDMVRAPYRFIAGLTIRREDIYEEEREGD